MISITEKKNCCGCSACVQVCTKNCISLKEDFEGFLYPSVNTSICINCGLCEKVCPIIKSEHNSCHCANPQAYIAYIKNDDIRCSSSSGGLFTAFATEVLTNKGIVFGASFDNEFQVYHTAVTTVDELAKLRGSKYLQSRIEKTYIETQKYLKNNRTVLFTGTACQIAGLKAFLGREYDNLITIDVLCHGVPTPKLWKKYLNEQQRKHGATLKRVSFRDKKLGWRSFSMLLEFSNGIKYECIHKHDLFMRFFTGNICLRPSCHCCCFKGMDRPSDISLGDCWGVENHMPEMFDEKGVSVLLVHTERGRKYVEKIIEQIEICSAELDQVLPPSTDSRKSVIPHPKRRSFFRLLKMGFSTQFLFNLLKPSLFTRINNRIKRLLK